MSEGFEWLADCACKFVGDDGEMNHACIPDGMEDPSLAYLPCLTSITKVPALVPTKTALHGTLCKNQQHLLP